MNRHINRSASLFLLLLHVLPLMYLISDSFGCRLEAAFPLWMAGLCLTMWLSVSFRHGVFIGLPFSALLLYAAYRHYGQSLVPELTDLLDRITGAYYEHFYAPGSSYLYADGVLSHSLIFIFLGFLIASYMATALSSRSGRVALGLIGSLPIFAACIAVNGSPDAWIIVCLLLFWILLVIGGGTYEPEANNGQAVFAAALPAALLLCGLLAVFNPSEYSYDSQDVAISRRFDSFGSAIKSWMGGSLSETMLLPYQSDSGAPASLPAYVSGWQSGGEMDLTQAYDPSSRESLILRVRADTGGYTYLRGISYGDYTGTGWLPAESAAPGSSLGFAAAAAAGEAEHEMQLRMVAGGEYMFLPYYCGLSSGSDLCVPLDKSSYTVRYHIPRDAGSLHLPEDYAAAELEYRSYAHDYYTRLPQSTGDAMLAVAAGAGIYPDSPGLIEAVAALVQASVPYDLNTEPYPSTDYALYFFNGAESGYCVHYATAAAAMYRALGVPARVTEGFLFDSQAREFTDVRGKDAHAWVEVYLDGLGWLPVEVTGSGAAQTAPAPQQNPTSESAAPEKTAGEEAESGGGAAPSPGTESLPVGLIGTQDNREKIQERGIEFPAWILCVLPVLFLAAFPFLWRTALVHFRRRAMAGRDGGKAAVAIWQQAKKVSRFGGEIPLEIVSCAEKAAFSTHEITVSELQNCHALLEEMTKNLYRGLNPAKKFVFKYMHGLI